MDAIINKYGYKPGLTTREGKITNWPYEEKKPTIAELKVIVEEYENSIAHIKARKKEYPSIEDQLDLLYHHGIDGWKVQIKAIKDKYPKK
jgi:hypothetical protein